ncbi:VPS10 domain-containing protein [Labilibacter marinus]|uniref:VPS10 domain-containing protein n=1 Tax=Labilibacter marinus TaxID=1477105 RepID=UPI00082B30C1|nr:T9SS type A sorting domain-containing protein [Labilibacter marinus]
MKKLQVGIQLKTIVFLCAILIQSTVGFAQFFEKLKTERVESGNTIMWDQVSPGNSGFANLLRYHPTIPEKVAFCQDMWNHYQSDDNGERWYSTKDPDGDNSFGRMLDIEFSVSNPKLSIAIATSELWMSTDTGRTFTPVTNCAWYDNDSEGRDQQGWRKKVAAVAIDPNDADIWFVAGGSNVRGQDWMSCYQDVNKDNPRGKTALNEGKLWRTTNAGANWTLVNSGLNAAAQIGRIVVNPKNSQQVFASSNYGVYKSTNGGTSWTQVTDGQLDNDIIMDMDYYYDETSGKFILYVIDQVHYLPNGTSTKCTGGIYRSDDEGANWVKMNGNLGLNIGRLTGGVPNNYYKYIAKWLDITEAVAKSTYPSLPTEALQYFNMLSTDPSREGALYIGFADPQVANSIMPGRLWTTSNNGEKWINTARLYEDAWERDKAYWEERGNPWEENMVVGHASPHMRFGTDYALRSMRGLDVGVNGSVMIISDHSTMLSTDHGATWQQMDEEYTPSGAIVGRGNSNLPGLTIAQDKRKETTLLGSGEHYLWIPTDDSPDERQAIKFIESTQPSVSCLAYDPFNVDIVYSTSSRQENKQDIFRSNDRGENWENYGVATPATNKWLDDFYTNGLIIDPTNNQYMYHGITKIVDASKGTQGGFFYSNDYGKTFRQSNSGLPSPARINDIKFDPRDHSNESLFIAAENYEFTYNLPQADGGLYHSTNRGQSWTKVNTPSEVKGVHFIEIDHTNRMYITTGYRGAGAGVWYTDDFGDNWTQVFEYPGTECIDVSPFDHNLMVVTCKFMSKNPGVFVSRDRGATWAKSNKNIVIPQEIEDIKFDILDASKMWLATKGTGFYRGTIENGDQIQVVQTSPQVAEATDETPIQLSASIVNSNFAGESIVWKSDNPSIATVDENGLVTPIKGGLVNIWATTADGRYSDFTVITVQKNVSVVDGIDVNRPYVYPNPVTNELFLANMDLYSGADVINVSGQIIKQFKQQDSLDVSDLTPGVYFLKVNSFEETVSLRFLKQ